MSGDGELAARLKREVEAVRAAGGTGVSLEVLEACLAESAAGAAAAAKERPPPPVASKDAELELSLASFHATIEAGREALKAAVLINGGGAVALLSFLGAAVARGMPAALGMSLTLPLACFGAGVLLAAAGFGARYGAQVQYRLNHMRAGNAFNRGAISAGVLAYAAFGIGVAAMFLSFRGQFAS